MDLGGWNADFDPNLLGEWTEEVDPNTTTVNVNEEMKTATGGNDGITNVGGATTSNPSKSPSLSLKGDASWEGNFNQYNSLNVPGLPAFSDDDPAISERSLGDAVESGENQDGGSFAKLPPSSAATATAYNNHHTALTASMAEAAAAISETTSVTSARDERSAATRSSGASSGSSISSNNNRNPVNHPLALTSSASCPPPGSSSSKSASLSGHGALGPFIIHPPSTSADLYSVDLSQALERIQSVHPSAATATTAGIPAVPLVGIPNSNSANNPHLSTLANNFLLAASASLQPPPATGTVQNHLHVNSMAKPAGTFPPPGKAGVSQKHSQQGPGTAQSGPSSSTSSSLPPFYLFDAPIELRANFMANQRKLGLPIEHDPNSFYYGETVNGYHPQQLLKAGINHPQRAANLLQVGAGAHHRHGHRHPHPNPPQMIDARHGNNRRSSKGGQVKNEREQKRAQKITELIEQLRVQIEDSGWQVDGRSKFNTLSKCAEYVKHMVKSTTEKEEEVKKLKSEMEVKKRKAEEDKAMQESRSDPESVTSSLTSDTTGSRRSNNSSSGDNQSTADDNKKRKNKDEDGDIDSSDSGSKHKKPRVGEAATEESSGEGRDGGSKAGSRSGSGSASGGGPSAQGYSIDKAISTVSDLTDSNRCSSSNNSGSASGSGETDEVPEEGAGGDRGAQPSSSSISSDAAVASEKTSRGRHIGHKDVVFKNEKRSRKRPPAEVTSLERSFELDYEEVFDKSNIPQLIATTSGKIISTNDCFVKATGYLKSEIELLTIFSLVRPDKLSNFFDIVAAALRPHYESESDDNDCKPPATASRENTTKEDDSQKESVPTEQSETGKSQTYEGAKSEGTEVDAKEPVGPSRLMDYTTITLPCVDFPAMKKRNQAVSDIDSLIDPLTVTVTLMGDKDPRKRCFHCVFTNCRGTDGALGTITPELLASLFSTPLRRRKKHMPSKRKRSRMTEDQQSEGHFLPPPPRPPKSIGGPPEPYTETNAGGNEGEDPN